MQLQGACGLCRLSSQSQPLCVAGCGHSFHNDCVTPYILKVAESGADVLCPVCFAPLSISVPECTGGKRRSRDKEEDKEEERQKEIEVSVKRQRAELNCPSQQDLSCNVAGHQEEDVDKTHESLDASSLSSTKELSPRSTIERIREKQYTSLLSMILLLIQLLARKMRQVRHFLLTRNLPQASALA